MIAALIAAAVASAPVVAVYYAASDDPKAAAAIPAGEVTHVIYAFAVMCGDDPSFSAAERKRRAQLCKGRRSDDIVLPSEPKATAELASLANLKKRNPKLRLIVSIGGWGMPLYPRMAASPPSRERFIHSAVALLRTHRELDGIDIDWEYPGGGDAARPLLKGEARAREQTAFHDLASGLRRAFDKLGRESGRHYLLTAAVAGYPRSIEGVDWQSTQGSFDYLFVMTYDFTPEKGFAANGDYSGGGGLPGHHTNLHATRATGGYGADAMVANLLKAGVPAGKMAIGAAFYGREWKDVDWAGGNFPAAARHGAFVGTPGYGELKKRNLSADGFRYGYDPQAQAAYYAAPRRFISLDDRRSICAKAAWAMLHGLAGIFAWEASQDDGTLTQAMRDGVDGRCGTKTAR